MQKKLIRKCIDDRIDSWGHGDIGQKHLDWNPRQKVLGAKAARNPLETLGRDLIKLGIKKTKFYQKPTTIAVIASKLDWCHFPAQMSKLFQKN